MLSKIFSSKKALIKRDITNTWPVWGGMFFVTLWIIPINTLFRVNIVPAYILSNSFSYQQYIIIPFCILMVARIFGYLFEEKATVFYHSLPYTRIGMFITKYITGYSLLVLVLFAITIINVFIGIGNGYGEYTGVNFESFLYLAIETLYLYSLAVLIAVVFGSKSTCYVMYIAVLFLANLSLEIYNNILKCFLWGYYARFFHLEGVFLILSPFSVATNISCHKDMGDVIFEEVGLTIVLQLISIVVFSVLAFLLYKIRKSENSGNVVTFKAFNIVFKVVFALFVGGVMFFLFGSIIISNSTVITHIRVVSGILLVFFVTLSFIIAEMIVAKRFNVFKAAYNRIICIIIVMIAFVAAMSFDIFGLENNLPDKEEVEDVSFAVEKVRDVDKGIYEHRLYISTVMDGKYDNPIVPYKDKLIEDVLSLHKDFVENNRDTDGEYNLYITYFCADNKVIRYRYNVDNSFAEDFQQLYKPYAEMF